MGRLGRSTRGPHWRRLLGTTILSVVVGTLIPLEPALAHGVVDQTPDQQAGATCSPAEYVGTKLVTLGESRQSFVPTHPGLASIELCIANLVGIAGADFTVHLYEGETALTHGGTPLASVPVDAGSALLTSQWVHVDFPAELRITPGATYVVGLAPAVAPDLLSSVEFQWRSTCGLLTCLGVADRYPPGRTNDLPANADYGFRTFGLEDADLLSEVTVDPVVCPGLDLTGRATGNVRNDSGRSVGAFDTEWVWSQDATLDALDTVIPGGRTTVPGMAAGTVASIPAPVLPGNLPHGDGHLLLHVDVDDEVIETADANNVAAGTATVTACGQPAITGLAVTVDQDEVPTGFHQRQLADLDPAALASLPQSRDEALDSPAITPNGLSPNGLSPNGLSPNGLSPNGLSPNGLSPNGLSPNGLSPNGLSPNGLSPNGLSPAGGVLLTELADDLPSALLEQMLVVNIPAVVPWAQRLAPFTDEPVQNITLARALSLDPTIRVGEIDWTHVLNVSWLAFALANGALDDTQPPDGQGWCTFLAAHGFDCAANGIDPATTSLLGLEAAGFPASQVPIAHLPLTGIDTSAFLVNGFRLTGSPRFNLEHTRLGQLDIHDALTTPSTVVDCGTIDCTAGGSVSLVEASAAGALRDVDVRTLLDGLTPAGRASATVGDLGLGTATVSSLRLATANWKLADAHRMDNACPAMTYRLSGTNTGSAAAVDPTTTVSLAPGFVYVPGSAMFGHDGGAPASAGEPSEAVAADGTRSYTFPLEGIVAGDFELSFAACGSVYLGTTDVGTATIEGVGIEGPYAATTDPTAADQVTVVERTPGVTTAALDPNPSVAGPDDNIVVADHISEAGAHDSWTIPVSDVPRTMYIVRLFPPTGVDYDLIGFGPQASASRFSSGGFSPNGLSPNGLSPNGISPNGISPNGISPNGLSPNGLSPNGLSPNGLSTNGSSYTAAPDLNDDLPIQELRPGDPANPVSYAVSANRGDTPETLYLFSNFGDEGNLTLSVADHNGSRSDAPYFVTVQTVQPNRDPRLATCQAAPFDALPVPEQSAPVQTAWSEPRTLFVANRQVTSSIHGATAADDGIAALQRLAARPELRGLIAEVDADREVAEAFNRWRTGDNWCQPTVANEVAVQIRNLILDLRSQYPTIDTVVLAGGDEAVPDFRLPDASSLGNELHYVEPLLNATGGNNALVAAFANGTIISADPYGNDGALRFGEGFAFPPSAGVSRLPEGPSSWIGQVQLYEATNGDLDPSAGMVSGYDGMVDGADAAADVLEGAGIPTSRLTDEAGPWTAADFRRDAFTGTPGIAGYNAHANHWTILSDAGSDQNDLSDIVSTAEAAGVPTGALVFSNGCHFGTSVSDALNSSPDAAEAARLNDWNQAITARQGIAVTNSGFGIFDTLEVGQGERLQQLFLEQLQTAPNASLALARAKNIFLATAGVQDPYSFKTLQQLQVYGLGIFKMAGADREQAPTPRPAAAASADVSVGPYAIAPAGSDTCTDCYRRRETAYGTAIDLVDPDVRTGHTSTSGYWSAPLSYQEVPLPADTLSAGLWINDMQSQKLTGVDPVITRLGVNRPDREIEPQSTGVFPTSFGQVVDVGGTSYVTLLHGISRSTGLVDGEVRSEIFLTTELDAEILYKPASTPGCTPHVDEVTLVRPPNASLEVVDVVASELCGPNLRVAALGRDIDGSWAYRELGQGPNGHWSGSLPAGTQDLHVQVFNGVGIGHWRNKGDEVVAREAIAQGVSVLFSGAQHSSGVYTDDVTGTVAAAAGATCAVHDNDHLVGSAVNGGQFTVSGDGAHEISVHCDDGSLFVDTVAIDASTPVVVLTTPPPSTTYFSNDVVLVDFSCADSGTGSTCTATNDGVPIEDGEAIDTATPGMHTVRVTATDAVGRIVTLDRAYEVVRRYTISELFSPIKPRPSLNSVSPSSNIAVKFTVTDNAGVEVTDPAVIAERYWVAIDCSSKALVGTPFTTAGTTPEYSGFFHFNTDAPGSKGCFELVVVLVDGSQQSAYFRVK